MAQGIFAGMTDYSDQSLSDIATDIHRWIEYCQEVSNLFERNIKTIKSKGLWEGTIPLDFQIWCLDIPQICSTYIHDFQLILSAVENDIVSQREIKLMDNLYQKAHENERLFVDAFKHSGRYGWCEFGTPEFEEIEDLYAKGRDFFVTMFDIDNVAGRMEDYMKDSKVIVDNSTHTDQSIHFGDKSTVQMNGKNAQLGNNNNKTEKETVWDKFHLPIIVSVIGGLIVAIICAYLHIN